MLCKSHLFLEHLFLRIPLDGCFWKFLLKLKWFLFLSFINKKVVQICKNYQNITSNLVFTIVFRIYCNFLIVVPFRFKTCRFNVFCFTRQNICARKIGSAFCPGCVICFSFIAYEDNSILLICYLRHLPVQA